MSSAVSLQWRILPLICISNKNLVYISMSSHTSSRCKMSSWVRELLLKVHFTSINLHSLSFFCIVSFFTFSCSTIAIAVAESALTVKSSFFVAILLRDSCMEHRRSRLEHTIIFVQKYVAVVVVTLHALIHSWWWWQHMRRDLHWFHLQVFTAALLFYSNSRLSPTTVKNLCRESFLVKFPTNNRRLFRNKPREKSELSPHAVLGRDLSFDYRKKLFSKLFSTVFAFVLLPFQSFPCLSRVFFEREANREEEKKIGYEKKEWFCVSWLARVAR